MEQIELTVNERKVLGKKVRFLRRQGTIPVHLFGHNVESMALQTDLAQLKQVLPKAGKTRLVSLKIGSSEKLRSVMVREVQKNPVTGALLHVDLYEVSMTEKVRVDVPLVLIGEAPALKVKENMLMQDLRSLSVECLPDRIPDKIEVDLSILTELDQAVRVKDIAIENVEVLNEPELVIVKISARPIEKVEEVKPAVEEAVAAEAAPAEAAAGEAREGAKAEAKEGAKAEAKEPAKAEKKGKK